MKTGMVSVTFRGLSPREIIELTREAGLDGIEWGADVHATGPAAAAEIRGRMGDLEVFSLGSYYRLGCGQDFAPEVETARALGAPNIRIWAGPWEPHEASEAERRAAVEEARRAADLCAAAGMTLSFEYHGGTLTSTQESAVRLWREIGRPNLRLYWQPLVSNPTEQRAAHLQELGQLGALKYLHVYRWIGPDNERRPLSEGIGDWQSWIDAARGGAEAALLEFVREDDPAQFLEDARTLRQMVKGERV